QPPLRVRSAFRSRLRALGRLAVPPGRYVVGAAPTVGARSHATAAPSFIGPLRQPEAGITAGTDESRSQPTLLSHGASWRTIDSHGLVLSSVRFRLPSTPSRVSVSVWVPL